MQKFLRTLTMLALMLVPMVSQGQLEVTVGELEGAANNSYLPMNSLYNYSYTQQIYTAEEIGMGGTITSITVWMYGNADLYEMPFDIYMAETDKDAFSGNTDWVTVTAADLVYSGSVTVHNTEAEAYTFVLDNPFVYTGASNLVIAFNNTTGQWKSGLNGKVFGATGDPNRAIYVRQDGSAYDPFNPTFTATSTTYQRNVITFGINPAEVACTKPYDLEVSDLVYDGFVLSWSDTNDEGVTFTIREMVNGEETLVATGIQGTTYTFTGLTANTSHLYKVYANCSAEEESYGASISLKTPCGPMTLPFTEDFEDIDHDGAFPDCWNLILSHNTDPSANNVFNHTTGGANSMFILTASDDSNMFATDAVPLAGNNIYVKFWARIAYYSTYSPWIQAGVMTDLEDPTTFIPLVTVNNNNGQWQQVEFTTAGLEVEEGASYYVAWLGYGGYAPSWSANNYANAVDDIYISEIPDCLHITGLTAASNSSTTVDLEWPASANEEATYNVFKQVTVEETPEWVLVANVATNAYTVEELEANTNYTFGVSVVCGDFETDTVMASARTLSNENALTAFNATGTMVRDEIELDAEAHSAVVPVWYATNLNNLTLSWTISTGAAFAIDTTGDESYTCIVTTSTIKDYLRVNVPMTLRLYAEDHAIYTDYTLLLQGEECVADRNLTFNAERIRFTAMWENPDTLVTTHNIICSLTELDAEALSTAEYVTVENAHQYTFEGLERNTQYYVYVKGACATEWVSGTVTTRALGADVNVVVADGESTNGYVPVYGFYADAYLKAHYVYPADMLTELNGLSIPQMTFYATQDAVSWGSANFKVYVGEVADASISAFADLTALTQVYEGALSIVDGQMTIVFNQPYAYNGGNLLVAVENTATGSYVTSTWYGVSATGASVQGYSYSSLSAVSATQRNFLPKFSTSISMPADACPQVTNVEVEDITHNSASISWIAADADYCVGNQIIVSEEMIEDFEGVTPVELAATATSYEATNLLPEHTYYIFIKTLCNGEEHNEGTSGWATATFTTFPTCRPASDLEAQVTGKHTANLTWVNGGESAGQADNFDVLLSTVLYNDEELAEANPSYTGVAATTLDVVDLLSDTTYYFYVRNVNEELECTSAWSEPGSFHTLSAMPAVQGPYAGYITHNAFTGSWLRNDQQFADETAWRIALVAHEAEPTADDWETVTDYDQYEFMGVTVVLGMKVFIGLTPETTYDFYVAPYDVEEDVMGDVAMIEVTTEAFPPACYTIEAEETTSNSYLPVYGLYADEDQVNQFIYPAEMLEAVAGQSITSMHFSVYSGGSADWGNVTVKLAEVEASTMTELISGVEQTTVYTGTAVFDSEEGWTITFDEPYAYNGGNLLVEFDYTTDEGWTSASFIAVAAANCGICTYSGNTYAQNSLPVAEFCYIREGNCLDITHVRALSITANSADLFWYPGNEETEWQYFVTDDPETDIETLLATVQTVNSNELTLTGLQRETTYYFAVRGVCDAEEEVYTNWKVVQFTTKYEAYNFNVTVVAANGTVEGAGSYTEDTEATLEATPATGYHFVAWMNGEEVLSEENPYTFTVTEDISITAVFAPNTYTVDITVNDETMGSIEGLPETDEVAYGTVLNLTAVANDGFRFVSWSNEAVSENISLTVTDDVTLVATFEAIPTYTITVNATEGGTVTNAGANTVAEGATFTATATANTGYHFVGWSNGETNATVTITNVHNDLTLTATFAADPQPATYTITVNYDHSMGTVSGEGTYNEGDMVTLVATALPGYEFLGWSNGLTSNTITFPATENLTLSANFGLVGIDDVDMNNVNIYSVEGKIVVRGAEGNSVYVFDVNGRTLNNVNNASDMVEFRMEQTGVYLVKVGNAAAKRVVVVR